MSRDLEQIEIKVAFLEEALQQLSDEHFKQQRDLVELNKKYLDLKNKIDNQSHADDISSEGSYVVDEKPPHY